MIANAAGTGTTTQELESVNTTTPRKEGTTTISDQVVAKIAGIAAREVSGVHQLTGTGFTGAVSSLASKVSGAVSGAPESRDFGVKVQVGQHETIVNLAMIVNYGASIPSVAKAVRKTVTDQLQIMTGLVAREINIAVIDIFFPDDETPTAATHQLQ